MVVIEAGGDSSIMAAIISTGVWCGELIGGGTTSIRPGHSQSEQIFASIAGKYRAEDEGLRRTKKPQGISNRPSIYSKPLLVEGG